MELTINVNADPRIPKRQIEVLERSIAETRMAAAIATDWDELHRRSRDIVNQFNRETDPSGQVAAVRQIRETLRHANDVLGLRALRLAVAGSMMGWLRLEATNTEAQVLGRLFKRDQRLGIPGLADLEEELERAQNLVQTDESVRDEIRATGD